MSLNSKQIEALNSLAKYFPSLRDIGNFGTNLDQAVETAGGKSFKISLTPDSSSEIDFLTIPTGKGVSIFSVEVIVPFNGTADLKLGTQANDSLIMKSKESSLDEKGIYISSPLIVFDIDTLLILRFNSGGSSVGLAELKINVL